MGTNGTIEQSGQMRHADKTFTFGTVLYMYIVTSSAVARITVGWLVLLYFVHVCCRILAGESAESGW